MVYKIAQSVYKEYLLLKRDLGGVIILFIMPLVLIIAVTLIQDSTFKKIKDSKISVLIINQDNGSVGKSIVNNLEKSEAFTIITKIGEKPVTEEQAKNLVFGGKYLLAIIIPKQLSSNLENKINQNVTKIVASFSEVVPLKESEKKAKIQPKIVKLYFDPAAQLSFKNTVMSSIDKIIAQIETQSIYNAFQKELGDSSLNFEQSNFISFKEINPKKNNQEIIPNSVQHNVPAWTLFAIFFIVIPLSINIVKEKTQGTFIRLQTQPVASYVVLLGKIIMYSIICMLQFYMMVLLAVFIFPKMGLPPLNIQGNLVLMSVVALFSGLAAIGFGILIGTIAKTQEQAAPFGATATIVLAAIGGVWVPVFAMSKTMQIIAQTSPMNWGLNAFYDVLLRQSSIIAIMPEIILLFLFFIVTIAISLIYDKKKRSI